MTPDAVIAIAACASVPLGLLWVEYHRRRDDRLAEIRRCQHVPGPPIPVGGSTNMFKRTCSRCRAQQHCERDGTPWKLNDRWE